jgi:hypothetical protein
MLISTYAVEAPDICQLHSLPYMLCSCEACTHQKEIEFRIKAVTGGYPILNYFDVKEGGVYELVSEILIEEFEPVHDC